MRYHIAIMHIIVTMKALLPSALAKTFLTGELTSYIHVTYACMYDVWWQLANLKF